MKREMWGTSAVETSVAALLVSFLLGVADPVVAGSKEGPLVGWRHGMIQAKGDAAFTALYALEKGFFRKHGLDVHIIQLEGSLQLTQALLAGELDTAENNADPVLRAFAKGANVVAIGSTIAGIAYNLYSKKEITTFPQLRGKTVGISRPGSFPDLVTRAMLFEKGLDPNSITFVSAGDDATRYKALVAGKIDAVAASAEFVPQAKRDGVYVLGEAAKLLPHFPRFLIWANPKTLQLKPNAAVAFLAGMIEGLQLALSNRDEAIKWTAKKLGLDPDNPRLAFTYDLQGPLVARTAELPRQKVEFVVDFLLRIGDIEKVPDVKKVLDTSFQERALQVVEGTK